MKPATLEQIGALGSPEKMAAREYVTQEDGITPRHDFQDPAVAGLARMAFLQGIHWERERGDMEALGALRAVLQGMPGGMVTPAYAATLDRARALLAARLKV